MDVGLVVIGLLQAVVLALVVRTANRLDSLTDRVGDLRVELARIGTRLDDHVGDPRAHTRR